MVPQMDMDLHLAKVQQRWRYADDELQPDEVLRIEQLAQDFSAMPIASESTGGGFDALLNYLFDRTRVDTPVQVPGGCIEPASDPGEMGMESVQASGRGEAAALL
jgi:type IV secretion system protein VirD4